MQRKYQYKIPCERAKNIVKDDRVPDTYIWAACLLLFRMRWKYMMIKDLWWVKTAKSVGTRPLYGRLYVYRCVYFCISCCSSECSIDNCTPEVKMTHVGTKYLMANLDMFPFMDYKRTGKLLNECTYTPCYFVAHIFIYIYLFILNYYK